MAKDALRIEIAADRRNVYDGGKILASFWGERAQHEAVAFVDGFRTAREWVHRFTPPSPEYCAICGYDREHPCHESPDET